MAGYLLLQSHDHFYHAMRMNVLSAKRLQKRYISSRGKEVRQMHQEKNKYCLFYPISKALIIAQWEE